MNVSRRSVLVGSVLGVALVGCSHEEEHNDQKWVNMSMTHVSVSHPASFTKNPQESDDSVVFFEQGDRWITVNDKCSVDKDPVLAFQTVDRNMRQSNVKVYQAAAWKEVIVPGAAKAIECPFVYLEAGKKNPIYGYWFFASLLFAGTSLVTVAGPKDDPEFAHKVLSTMKLHDHLKGVDKPK